MYLVGDPRAAQEFITWYFQVSGKKNPFDITTVEGKRTVKVVATADQLEKVLYLYGKLFEGDFPACDPNQRGTGWPVEIRVMWQVNGQWHLWGHGFGGEERKVILQKIFLKIKVY